MQESIEVYVRPSSSGVLLNLYVPLSMQAQFLDGIRKGTFAPDAPINLEFTVLPQWVCGSDGVHTDDSNHEPPHVRVVLSAINVHYVD